jgi:hypothetical protein
MHGSACAGDQHAGFECADCRCLDCPPPSRPRSGHACAQWRGHTLPRSGPSLAYLLIQSSHQAPPSPRPRCSGHPRHCGDAYAPTDRTGTYVLYLPVVSLRTYGVSEWQSADQKGLSLCGTGMSREGVAIHKRGGPSLPSQDRRPFVPVATVIRLGTLGTPAHPLLNCRLYSPHRYVC